MPDTSTSVMFNRLGGAFLGKDMFIYVHSSAPSVCTRSISSLAVDAGSRGYSSRSHGEIETFAPEGRTLKDKATPLNRVRTMSWPHGYHLKCHGYMLHFSEYPYMNKEIRGSGRRASFGLRDTFTKCNNWTSSKKILFILA